MTVHPENIKPGSIYQYQKCEGVECLTFGTPYDCSSVMHYRDTFFRTSKSVKTMTAKDPSSCDLSGYMTKLTDSDITILQVRI